MARRILPHAPDSTLSGALLAVGEIAYNETTRKLVVGDGSTLGGNSFEDTKTYTSVAALRLADPVTVRTAQLSRVSGVANGTFSFVTTSGPAFVDDGVSVIKAGGVDLTVGAWVRNSAAGIRTSNGSNVQAMLDQAVRVETSGPNAGFTTTPVIHRGGAGGDTLGLRYNIALGTDALRDNQYLADQFPAGGGVFYAGGDMNIAIGREALLSNTSGRRNTAIGIFAGRGITTGYYNTLIGPYTGYNLTSGNENTFVGVQSCQYGTTAYNNTGFGMGTLNSLSSGFLNTADGWQALRACTTGSRNVGVGAQAGYVLTTAIGNVHIGYQAGSAVTTGNYNVMIGDGCGGSVSTGTANVFVGRRAGSVATLSFNTFIGEDTGVSTTIGQNNTFVGYSAGASNVNGNANVAMGRVAFSSNVSGTYNTALGESSLYASTGNSNTAVGNSAGSDLTSGSNNSFLGAGAQPSAASVSNQITLGNPSVTSLRCATSTITTISDRRDKAAIDDLDIGLAFINSLTPRRWLWNMRDGSKVGVDDMGMIAQELEAACEAAGTPVNWFVNRSNPDRLEATPGALLFPLLNAVKELSARVVALEEAATQP